MKKERKKERKKRSKKERKKEGKKQRNKWSGHDLEMNSFQKIGEKITTCYFATSKN